MFIFRFDGKLNFLPPTSYFLPFLFSILEITQENRSPFGFGRGSGCKKPDQIFRSLPMKQAARVPGPQWAPITGPMIWMRISLISGMR